MYKSTKKELTRGKRFRIVECFLDMIQKKHISEITIAGLCETAGVTRSTFYRHFEIIEDVADFIIDDIVCQKNDNVWIFPSNKEVIELEDLKKWFLFWKKNKQIMPLLQYPQFRERLLKNVMMRMSGELNEKEVAFSVATVKNYFVINGVLSLLERWYESGYQKSEEIVAEMLLQLLTSPLIENEIRGY